MVCAGNVGGGHVWESEAPSWDLPWLPFSVIFLLLEFWKWPHFQVVLATGLAGEEGPLLLEHSPGKCLSRNKHGSHLNTTAAVT